MGVGAAIGIETLYSMVERPVDVGMSCHTNCVTKAIPCWRKVGVGPIHLCQFEPDGSFVRDAIKDGTILPSYVPTEVQLVDIFTKPYLLEKEAGL